MSSTYRILNQELGIGNPVIEINRPTIHSDDVGMAPNGKHFIRLVGLVLQMKDSPPLFLNRFLHAETRAEFFALSGKKVRVTLEIVEQMIAGEDGAVRTFMHLNLLLTSRSVTHKMEVTSKIANWEFRKQVPVIHAGGYHIILSDIASHREGPRTELVADVTADAALPKEDNVLRMARPLPPKKAPGHFVRGALVRAKN